MRLYQTNEDQLCQLNDTIPLIIDEDVTYNVIVKHIDLRRGFMGYDLSAYRYTLQLNMRDGYPISILFDSEAVPYRDPSISDAISSFPEVKDYFVSAHNLYCTDIEITPSKEAIEKAIAAYRLMDSFKSLHKQGDYCYRLVIIVDEVNFEWWSKNVKIPKSDSWAIKSRNEGVIYFDFSLENPIHVTVYRDSKKKVLI